MTNQFARDLPKSPKIVSQRQCNQRNRNQRRPHVQAGTVKGRNQARPQKLYDHHCRTGKEYRTV